MLVFGVHEAGPVDGVRDIDLDAARLLAHQVYSYALPPSETVIKRPLDEAERANLETAKHFSPNGEIDMRDYLIYQGIERHETGVRPSLKMVSLLVGPTVVRDASGDITRPLGYTQRIDRNGLEINETAISLSRIAELIPPELKHEAARIIAYTIVHETGHLFGLVNEQARRFTAGRHCGNLCVMRSTPNPTETHHAITQMGGRICFCAECTRDLRDNR